MKVVLQRVSSADVKIGGHTKSRILHGILILLGIEAEDKEEDMEWLIPKIINLRIFNDAEDKMNLSIQEVNGTFLVISQFTLHASTKKGNRPSYIRSARPVIALPLYEEFCTRLEEMSGLAVKTGEFGAHMEVNLVNDGPVTIIIDSKNRV